VQVGCSQIGLLDEQATQDPHHIASQVACVDQNGRVNRKPVVVLAACALAWVVGAALFHGSGGLNPAGMVPTAGCALALWGALRGEKGLAWSGTAIVALSSVLYLFGLGLVLVPAALTLVVAAVMLGRLGAPGHGSG
jgi:hypothetical protein